MSQITETRKIIFNYLKEKYGFEEIEYPKDSESIRKSYLKLENAFNSDFTITISTFFTMDINIYRKLPYDFVYDTTFINQIEKRQLRWSYNTKTNMEKLYRYIEVGYEKPNYGELLNELDEIMEEISIALWFITRQKELGENLNKLWKEGYENADWYSVMDEDDWSEHCYWSNKYPD